MLNNPSWDSVGDESEIGITRAYTQTSALIIVQLCCRTELTCIFDRRVSCVVTRLVV